MFPYSHATDALGSSDILVAIALGETEVEDALLLFRQMTDDELNDVCYALIFICHMGCLPCSSSLHAEPRFLVAKTLQTLVANARQQVALFGVGHQHRLTTEQTLKDVADHVFALLLIVEDSACHPQHLGIVLLEQQLDTISFHHVFFIVIPFRRSEC